MLTAWIAANVYAYVHGHTRTRVSADQQNKQERLVVNHAPWLDHDPLKINCSNALNFMTSTDAIAAKNAFVLITNLFVIKTNALTALRSVHHEIQSIGQLFRVNLSWA